MGLCAGSSLLLFIPKELRLHSLQLSHKMRVGAKLFNSKGVSEPIPFIILESAQEWLDCPRSFVASCSLSGSKTSCICLIAITLPPPNTHPLEDTVLWKRNAITPELLPREPGYTKLPFHARLAFPVPRGSRDRCSGRKEFLRSI